MTSSSFPSGDGLRKRVLFLVVAMLPIAIAWDVLNNPTSEAFIRVAIDAGLGLFLLFEIRNDYRTHVFLQLIVAIYAGVSLLDSVVGTEISRFDSGMTLTLMVILTVIHVATRPTSQRSTLFLLSLMGGWAVATVILRDSPPNHELGLLMLALPGGIVVVYAMRQLIGDLARASETAATRARVQQALASCSQALLKRDTEQPLTASLEALLDATEADYAYIDVNRTDEQGKITWEIVAEASGVDVPDDWTNSWMSGDFTGLEDAQGLLASGRPARLLTSQLTGEVKRLYADEGIKAELIAPIFIGDRWIGTVGYTDYNREGNWSEIEVDGLMRAAEMVSAYWEREAAREGLMELAQAKDQFIASVSHELRTPLSAVVGFAGELKRGRGDFSRSEIEEISTLIFAQSMEVSQLVDDLLTAERAATGNLTVKPTEFSLLRECEEVVEWTEGDHQIAVEGDDVKVRADTLRTRQVLRNLLTNAIRYGGETIRLQVSSNQIHAIVRIQDNGAGVRTGDAERIFEPYSRARGENTKPDSVGLGLSVARQLARLMGGDVTYKRSFGWTTFEFTLPLAAEVVRDAGAPQVDPDIEGLTAATSHPY